MEDKEDKEELMNKEELMTLPMPQGTSHCSCLEHYFLLQLQSFSFGLVDIQTRSTQKARCLRDARFLRKFLGYNAGSAM